MEIMILEAGDDHLPDNRIDKKRLSNDERSVCNESKAQNASRSHTPVNSSNSHTALEQTYYMEVISVRWSLSTGYDDGSVNWGESSNYVHANKMQIMSPVIYHDGSSLLFHPAYGFDPQGAYSPFSPIASPLSPLMIDSQFYSPQKVPVSASYYSRPVSPTRFSTSAGGGQEGLGENVFWGLGSGYYIHYPANTSLGFYNGPSDSVSNQSTPVGILDPYENNFGQQFLSGSSGLYDASWVNHNGLGKEVKLRDRESVNLTSDPTTTDRNRGPRASKPEESMSADHESNHIDLYNQPNFMTAYDKAKIFVKNLLVKIMFIEVSSMVCGPAPNMENEN
ncbi:hypothetical protein L1987_54574 [Smallanthus sonchifolius]|uniref:Uncharacterized protein n=1 Tax=Smallanthus sonchifolius TaxID=185202 RepID=A0ACB9E858_9ASTR|nr:hypothetical protein L1987_54574 [Smallanthus sonchifolius]